MPRWGDGARARPLHDATTSELGQPEFVTGLGHACVDQTRHHVRGKESAEHAETEYFDIGQERSGEEPPPPAAHTEDTAKAPMGVHCGGEGSLSAATEIGEASGGGEQPKMGRPRL